VEVQFNLPAGRYTESVEVRLRSETKVAQVYYTSDGSTANAVNGLLYPGAISMRATESIQAVAMKQSLADSMVTSASYTISAP
jgi:hypothetical protein